MGLLEGRLSRISSPPSRKKVSRQRFIHPPRRIKNIAGHLPGACLIPPQSQVQLKSTLLVRTCAARGTTPSTLPPHSLPLHPERGDPLKKGVLLHLVKIYPGTKTRHEHEAKPPKRRKTLIGVSPREIKQNRGFLLRRTCYVLDDGAIT